MTLGRIEYLYEPLLVSLLNANVVRWGEGGRSMKGNVFHVTQLSPPYSELTD